MNISSGNNWTESVIISGNGIPSKYLGASKVSNRTGTLIDYERLQEEDELIFDNLSVRTTFIVVYTIIFFFCFFGNLAVVLVVTLHWRMRSVTKFFLGNLAFANMCVGAFCVYQNLTTYLTDSWPFGVFLCKMYHFTNTLSHTASILILAVISIERYIVLLYPFKYRRILTIHRLRGIILGVWLLSAILSSPRLYYIDIIRMPIKDDTGQGPNKSDVICAPIQSIYDSKAADIVNFIILFLLPLGIITVMYTRIAMYLKQCEKLTSTMNTSTRECALCNSEELRQVPCPHGINMYRIGSPPSKTCVHGGSCSKEVEISVLSSTSTSGYTYQDYSQSENETCQIHFTKKKKKQTPESPSGPAVPVPVPSSSKKGNWKFRVKFRKETPNTKSNNTTNSTPNVQQQSCSCTPRNFGTPRGLSFGGRIKLSQVKK
ncbi:unnamed protein product, partial [Allacma fusca]